MSRLRICSSYRRGVFMGNKLLNRLIDPTLMQMFVHLHELGSFQAVAEKMSLTEQFVDTQMRRLEVIVGRKLLSDDCRRIELTNDGEVFLAAASQVVEVAAQVRQHFSSDRLDGMVRFGFTPGFSVTSLFPLLLELRREYPGLEVRCETARTNILIAKLESGALDVILGAQRDGDAKGEVVKRERLVWVGDLSKFNKETDSVPLVLLPAPAFVRDHAFEILKAAGIKWTVNLDSDDPAIVRAAVRAGWGAALFNESLMIAEAPYPRAFAPWSLPEPGHLEFFLRYNSVRNEHLIKAFVSVLRGVLKTGLVPASANGAANANAVLQ